MTLYYCGWNGCGQVHDLPSIISRPADLSIDGSIVSVSCSWSVLSVATDKSIRIMGFVGNQPSVSKEIVLSKGCKAINVSSCLSRTLIVCDQGKCYDYNMETDTLKQLVNFASAEPSNEETNCPEEDVIMSVTCSDYSNLAVSKSGRGFAIPSSISLPGFKVSSVCCGNEHSLLVTECGSVFTWGSGSRGQLGHSDLESEETPRVVEALTGIPVRSVSAGAWHNAVITSNGDLYTWGWGSDGQLGIKEEDEGESQEDGKLTGVKKIKLHQQTPVVKASEKFRGIVQAYPVPVDTPSDVDSVSCGSRHTVVLLCDGTIWGCGWNAYGQLASSPDDCTRSTVLRQISIPGFSGKISKINCGGWSSCFVV